MTGLSSSRASSGEPRVEVTPTTARAMTDLTKLIMVSVTVILGTSVGGATGCENWG